MQLVLYTNKSDNRTLNKSLVALSTVEINLKNEGELLNPVIILSSTYLPPAANYAYIANFGRYYFIEGQRILPGNQIELSLKVDVLMSWKSVINDSNVIAIRSTNRGHKMIPDNIPIQAKRNVIYKQFTGGNSSFGSDKISAETRCYLLTVLNGGV